MTHRRKPVEFPEPTRQTAVAFPATIEISYETARGFRLDEHRTLSPYVLRSYGNRQEPVGAFLIRDCPEVRAILARAGVDVPEREP